MKGVASDHAGAWYVTTDDSVLHVSAAGRVRSVAALEGVSFRGIAISPDGSALFVADCGNYKIRRVEAATGAVTTLAGTVVRKATLTAWVARRSSNTHTASPSAPMAALCL